jgi:competence ComEA-like helix-hairpin-helix protein
MTVESSIRNVSAAGQDRVNIQSADENSLTAVQGISPAIARAIVAYRGQNNYRSIADLLDVTPPPPQGSTNQSSSAAPGPPPGGSSGPKMISEELLMDIADDLTADSSGDLPGAININTAGLDVLHCLPGIDRELAQAIISYRRSSGFFPNIAWLLKVPGMTRDLFKQVAPLVSARSETFRILSEGKINSTGARQRIQVIVHIGLQDITTLSYREDDL